MVVAADARLVPARGDLRPEGEEQHAHAGQPHEDTPGLEGRGRNTACQHLDPMHLLIHSVRDSHRAAQRLQEGRTDRAPHEREADLEGWRVVLVADDDGEEEGRDEVGQGDDDGGEVLVDEVHDEVLLQTSRHHQ